MQPTLIIKRTNQQLKTNAINSLCTFGAILLFALGSLTDSANADLIIHVDFDLSEPGIQSSRSVMQGESFTANLILEFSGVTTAGLDSYWFSVSFENDFMTFVSATAVPVTGFTETAGSPNLIGINQVTPFAAQSTTPGAGPEDPFTVLVGTIDFSAGFTLGSFNIRPFEDPFFDESYDNNLQPIMPTFNAGSVSITAIPEPSSISFVCFAVSSLMLRRSRDRTAMTAVLRR
jgi:hypothetical protein